MAKRILVTGVGGAPGFELARSLQRLGCKVLAVDADPHAAGLLLPEVTAHVLPPAADAAYRTAIVRLCAEARPHAILSTVERELPQLVTLRRPLADLGVTTWLPTREAVTACGDKARFAAVLAEHGVATPRTVLPDDLDRAPDGLLVVKPRHGQGAKGVHACQTREQARVLCELVPAPIVQQHVSGREFTADCLVDRAGQASVILRYRLLVKGGLAVVSRTFTDAQVAECVRATLTATGVTGACCVQGFIRDEQGPDRVVITEANARVGGGFPASVAAGADYVGQYLRGLFRQDVDHDQLTYKPDVTLTRYVETLTTREGTAR
ncbi:ATP-grasp domain-containing protein [Streptomyces rugosispiralis]|uniref:ATP-grasp domain-containing protein n=1 Tax=Streptomyces rugosispiralis TaxID=2967341 RepID=A0ABT1V7U9_9ACTN|nr:ATP-grasp domain-containing protein [Streptomyces rugosispiralis]MCQ8193460.1 ATP-grasp domain-containing protein [Streptomyces rugosispiralis]